MPFHIPTSNQEGSTSPLISTHSCLLSITLSACRLSAAPGSAGRSLMLMATMGLPAGPSHFSPETRPLRGFARF